MGHVFKVGMIAAAVACSFAAETDVAKVHCTEAGLLIGVELIGNVIHYKDPRGYLARLEFDDQTVITKTGENGSESVKIDRRGLESGDLICATTSDGKHATRVVAVGRSIIERRQREFLAQWRRGSLYGVIQSVDPDLRAMIVLPADKAAASAVRVGLGPGVRYRKLRAAAKSVTEAEPASPSELKPGEQVYVFGVPRPGNSLLSASFVALGPNRATVGTISAIRPLATTVTVTELETGKEINVRVAASQLFRTAPSISTPTEIKTPAGVPLVGVGFGDLKAGDTVLVLGSSATGNSAMNAVILITSFGSFGVPADDPTAQITWLFQ